MVTLPKANICASEKRPFEKERIVSQPPFFRGKLLVQRVYLHKSQPYMFVNMQIPWMCFLESMYDNTFQMTDFYTLGCPPLPGTVTNED